METPKPMEIRRSLRRSLNERFSGVQISSDVNVEVVTNVDRGGRSGTSSTQRITQRSGRRARVQNRKGDPDGRQEAD